MLIGAYSVSVFLMTLAAWWKEWWITLKWWKSASTPVSFVETRLVFLAMLLTHLLRQWMMLWWALRRSSAVSQNIHFKTLKLISSNLNFSRCCITDGSSSITIDSTQGMSMEEQHIIFCVFLNLLLWYFPIPSQWLYRILSGWLINNLWILHQLPFQVLYNWQC